MRYGTIEQIRQTFSNADATIALTSKTIAQTGTLSAARALTLPVANALPAGSQISIVDESGTVTATNKITVSRAGSDTVNGGTTADAIAVAYGGAIAQTDGVSKWTVFFSKTGSTSSGSSPDASGWVRPSDWLAMPTVTTSEQKFVGLLAITNDNSNYISLSATTSSGTFTVDWGDGSSTQTFASNAAAEHQYTYSSISSSSLSSRGYRQVIVTVTPTTANLTGINLQKRHSRFTANISATPWLDITINGSSINSITIGGQSNTLISWMERCNIQTIGTLTTASTMFQYCYALQSVTAFNTASVTDFTSFFEFANIKIIPVFNTSNGTNFTKTINNNTAIEALPAWDLTKATTLFSFASTCSSLFYVPAYNTPALTDFSFAFYRCGSLKILPALNVSLVTSGKFVNCILSCNSLTAAPFSGARFAIDFSGCRLDRQAIIDIFNGLGTASGSQTVTIGTSNHGWQDLTAADKAIATGKGWTVA